MDYMLRIKVVSFSTWNKKNSVREGKKEDLRGWKMRMNVSKRKWT